MSAGEHAAGLGLLRGTVAVKPHSPEWDAAGRQTAAQLKALLGDAAADIQHIGSTAVRSICAKPILDLAAGVTAFDALLSKNELLAAHGFRFRGSDLPGQYLYVCGEGDFITHHIHAVIYRSEEWNNYLDLRDYLNCHDADAQAYAALKERLAAAYPADRITYTGRKSEWIRETLRKAKAWRAGGAV